jgi:hypothetical protein
MLSFDVPGDPAPLKEELDLDPEGTMTPDGQTLLAFSRTRTGGGLTWQDHLVVADNGDILAWLRKPGTWDDRCWLIGEDLTSTTRLLRVKGDGHGSARTAHRERLVTIDLATGKPEVLPVEETTEASWSAQLVPGGLLLDTAPGHRLLFLADGGRELKEVWNPGEDPLGRSLAGPVARGTDGALLSLMGETGGALARLAPNGTLSMLRSPRPGIGAWNVGTDGIDVVWTEGAVDANTGSGGERRVLRAPWPRGGAALEGSAEAIDPDRRGIDPFTVGCGGAVHSGEHPDDKVVSGDGRIDTLPASNGLRWGKALALSCTSVWLRLNAPIAALARVDRPAHPVSFADS